MQDSYVIGTSSRRTIQTRQGETKPLGLGTITLITAKNLNTERQKNRGDRRRRRKKRRRRRRRKTEAEQSLSASGFLFTLFLHFSRSALLVLLAVLGVTIKNKIVVVELGQLAIHALVALQFLGGGKDTATF